MDNFNEQFDNKYEDIKKAHVEVNKLYSKLDRVMGEYLEENKDVNDNYKFLIMGRCMNLLIYHFTLIKFNKIPPQETREGEDENEENSRD